MLSPELLAILRCPETGQPVAPAAAALIKSLNGRITAGELRNRGGSFVTERLDGGLMREDGAVVYPVRGGVPIMLAEEAIPLATP